MEATAGFGDSKSPTNVRSAEVRAPDSVAAGMNDAHVGLPTRGERSGTCIAADGRGQSRRRRRIVRTVPVGRPIPSGDAQSGGTVRIGCRMLYPGGLAKRRPQFTGMRPRHAGSGCCPLPQPPVFGPATCPDRRCRFVIHDFARISHRSRADPRRSPDRHGLTLDGESFPQAGTPTDSRARSVGGDRGRNSRDKPRIPLPSAAPVAAGTRPRSAIRTEFERAANRSPERWTRGPAADGGSNGLSHRTIPTASIRPEISTRGPSGFAGPVVRLDPEQRNR